MTDYEFWSLFLTAAIWLTGVLGIWRMDQKAGKRYEYWDDQSEKSDQIMASLKEATDRLRIMNERTAP